MLFWVKRKVIIQSIVMSMYVKTQQRHHDRNHAQQLQSGTSSQEGRFTVRHAALCISSDAPLHGNPAQNTHTLNNNV
jgi:hypothetical protein